MRSRITSPIRLAVGVVALSLFAGCAENRSTFFIQSVVVPTGDDCLLEPGNPRIASGAMDLAFITGYVAAFELVNQTFDRSEQMPLYLDNAGVSVEGAEVELHQDSPEGALIDVGGGQTAFTTYGAGFVPSAKPTEPSAAVIPFEIIPGSLGQQLASTLAGTDVPYIRILAGVRVFGHGTNGYEYETPRFFFPIDACVGCLIFYPPEADDPEMPGRCDSTEAPDHNCTVGQDRGIDCRFCGGACG